VKTKRCTKCNKAKPLSEFWKNSKSKDGLCYQCKSCYLKYQRERNKLKNMLWVTDRFRHLLANGIATGYGNINKASIIAEVPYTTIRKILKDGNPFSVWVLDRICVKLLDTPLSYYEELGYIRRENENWQV